MQIRLCGKSDVIIGRSRHDRGQSLTRLCDFVDFVVRTLRIRRAVSAVGRSCRFSLLERIASLFVLVDIEYVEYTDGTIAPASSINANPPPARTANSPVQRTPGRIADYDPLSEARPSPYSARQAATTVIYTSDKGPGAFTFATAIAATIVMRKHCMTLLYCVTDLSSATVAYRKKISFASSSVR